MKYDKIENMLASIVELLNHIDDTQKDILDLSERTVMAFHAYMEKNHLLHDTETLKAFQYQDIMAQQINAISEIVENIGKDIQVISKDQNDLDNRLIKLIKCLTASTNIAKEKKETLNGNALNPNNGEIIEYF